MLGKPETRSDWLARPIAWRRVADSLVPGVLAESQFVENSVLAER